MSNDSIPTAIDRLAQGIASDLRGPGDHVGDDLGLAGSQLGGDHGDGDEAGVDQRLAPEFAEGGDPRPPGRSVARSEAANTPDPLANASIEHWMGWSDSLARTPGEIAADRQAGRDGSEASIGSIFLSQSLADQSLAADIPAAQASFRSDLVSDELRRDMKASGIVNSPRMIRFLAQLARRDGLIEE